MKLDYKSIMKSLKLKQRDEQMKLFDDIGVHGFNNKLCGFNAVTGIGKTLAYVAHALGQNKPVIISVPTHQLAVQVMETCTKVNALNKRYGKNEKQIEILYGRQEFLSPSRVKKAVSNLDETDNVDQKERIRGLISASKSDDVTNLISSYLDEYGELPEGVFAKEIVCNREITDSPYHIELREDLENTDVIIISQTFTLSTFAMAGIPEKFRSGLCIIDEADALIGLAQSIFRQTVALSTIESVAESCKGKAFSEAWSDLDAALISSKRDIDILNKGHNVEAALSSLYKSLGRYRNEAAQELKWKLEELLTPSKAPLLQKKAGGRFSFVRPSYHSARVLASMVSENSNVWLFSGTLDTTYDKANSMDWTLRGLGFEAEDLGFYGYYEPRKYGTMKLALAGNECPTPIVKKNDDIQLNKKYIEMGARSIVESRIGHTLVATSSYTETKLLAEAIMKVDPAVKVIADTQGKKLHDRIAEFKALKTKRAILITPRAHVGTDIRADDGSQLIRTLVLGKLPFSVPSDDNELKLRSNKYVSFKTLKGIEYSDGYQKVTRRIIQTFGRGIRDEDDNIFVMILDPRFPKYGTETKRFEGLASCIPDRFREEYMKAKVLGSDNKKKVKLVY